MSFKDFLALKSSPVFMHRIKSNEEVVSVKALGEEAWDNCKKDLKQALWNHRDMDFDGICYFIFNTWYNKEKKYDEHYADVYFEIAVACLGEKEIKKRLKELRP